jgi:hypothetical protein
MRSPSNIDDICVIIFLLQPIKLIEYSLSCHLTIFKIVLPSGEITG